MVTVINKAVNPYSRFSLSDALFEATLEVYNIANELSVDIALENYCVLEGAFSDNEALTKIKDKIITALKTFKEKIFALVDKVVSSITTKITEAKILAMKPLYNKNKDAFKNIHRETNGFTSKSELNNTIRGMVSHVYMCNDSQGSIDDIFSMTIDNDMYVIHPDHLRKEGIWTADEVYKKYVSPIDDNKIQDDKFIEKFYIDGIDRGFDDNFSLDYIKQTKREVDREVSKNIESIKKFDKYDESLKKYPDMLKNNMNVLHGILKVWTSYIGDCIKVIKGIAKDVDDHTVEFREIK